MDHMQGTRASASPNQLGVAFNASTFFPPSLLFSSFFLLLFSSPLLTDTFYSLLTSWNLYTNPIWLDTHLTRVNEQCSICFTQANLVKLIVHTVQLSACSSFDEASFHCIHRTAFNLRSLVFTFFDTLFNRLQCYAHLLTHCLSSGWIDWCKFFFLSNARTSLPSHHSFYFRTSALSLSLLLFIRVISVRSHVSQQ